MNPSLGARARRSFTLIELVVVLIIIGTIAGLVLPQVSMLGRTADMAATASSQREVANNISLYFVLQKRYPIGMDSLLVGDGATTPSSIYVPSSDNTAAGTATTDKNVQVSGLPASGSGDVEVYDQLEVVTLTGNERRSITRCGFEQVYDHDYTIVNANNSTDNSAARLLGTDCTVAAVEANSALQMRLLPNGLPPQSTRLVAFGFGRRNDALGKTVNNAPIYPGADGLYYGRYIAYFLVYSTGERATLVNVTDSYGRSPEYSAGQFAESLPNGGRQG